MAPRLTYTDPEGTTRLRPGGIPLVVGLICVPIVLAMLVSVVTVEGSGLGVAVGAIAVATLIVLAVRARPRGDVEVAAHRDDWRQDGERDGQPHPRQRQGAYFGDSDANEEEGAAPQQTRDPPHGH